MHGVRHEPIPRDVGRLVPGTGDFINGIQVYQNTVLKKEPASRVNRAISAKKSK